MPIRILAPHEAAKIAAGEVIERPASVVKELVENALDAGATSIAVAVREGGLALIRIADDGCGIEPGELRLAFERHATSKVASEDDLWRVATLGFRGEALPSIAAAGEIDVVTRVAGNDVGARIRLRDGEVIEEGSGATPPGTVFTVRRLFSAQPARLKFLRSPPSEASQVTAVVTHYAMAYSEVRFELSVDGKTVLRTTGSGSVADAVAAVYGHEVAAAAIDVDTAAASDGEAAVRGVVCDPRVHRSSRNYIGLYVNRRWVKNRALTFAVEEAYQGMLPVGRRPVAVLNVTVPPDEVDVNVHPTKAEVRLRHERAVFGSLQRAVRRAVADRGMVPAASAGVWGGERTADGRPPLFLTQRPARMPMPSPATSALGRQAAAPLAGPEAPPASHGDPAPHADGAATVATMAERLPLLRAVGQVNATYVVAEGPDGMYLVDQHAAHERVLYERFLASVRAGRPDVQGLLEPLTVELGAPRRALLSEHAAAFAGLGFDIEHFGDTAYVVRSVPASLRGDDVAAAIAELLDRLARDDDAGGPAAGGRAAAAPEHRVAASLACHAAVRAGMAMSEQEQRELLRLLEACEAPRTCPHGRPTVVHLAADAIAREFRRK
jgi:DNA mismatch repair protein MutL